MSEEIKIHDLKIVSPDSESLSRLDRAIHEEVGTIVVQYGLNGHDEKLGGLMRQVRWITQYDPNKVRNILRNLWDKIRQRLFELWREKEIKNNPHDLLPFFRAPERMRISLGEIEDKVFDTVLQERKNNDIDSAAKLLILYGQEEIEYPYNIKRDIIVCAREIIHYYMTKRFGSRHIMGTYVDFKFHPEKLLQALSRSDQDLMETAFSQPINHAILDARRAICRHEDVPALRVRAENLRIGQKLRQVC